MIRSISVDLDSSVSGITHEVLEGGLMSIKNINPLALRAIKLSKHDLVVEVTHKGRTQEMSVVEITEDLILKEVITTMKEGAL